MRLIDADYMKEHIEGTNYETIKTIKEWIDNQPTIEPQRMRGKWTKDNACEFCGFKPWYERNINTLSFCPNCGADMRGGQE